MESGFSRLLLLSFISLLTLSNGLISLSSYGCGDRAQQIRLQCPITGNSITIIRIVSIFATYKPNCPGDAGAKGCDHFIPFTNPYYINITNECQGLERCFVQAKQLEIPLCSSTIHTGNYIEIFYDCIPNGVTVPTAEPGPTTAVSGKTLAPGQSNFTTLSPQDSTVAGNSSSNGAISEGKGETEGEKLPIAAIVVPLTLIFLIAIVLAVFVLSYRRKKLPPNVQGKLENQIFTWKVRWAGLKANHQKSPTPPSKSEPKSKFSPGRDKLETDEDIYASIEEPGYYSDWTAGNVKVVDNNLPAILVVPSGPPADDGWCDSDFESSDDDKPKPSVPKSKSMKPQLKKQSPRRKGQVTQVKHVPEVKNKNYQTLPPRTQTEQNKTHYNSLVVTEKDCHRYESAVNKAFNTMDETDHIYNVPPDAEVQTEYDTAYDDDAYYTNPSKSVNGSTHYSQTYEEALPVRPK